MGFALWRSDDQAWAQGTHEYRPMGCAVIAVNGQFRAPDFHRYRRPPGRNSPLFVGLFGSLEEVNEFLRRAKPRPSDVRTRILL
ncbi:MAG: hypothetical protein JNM66_03600 [Bryobacterales bacterium]|nr:hypothetical protein [Bryobacterales bacterium]